MAVDILTSDLITAYKNKQRVRTMNSAGSVICTTARNNNTFINKEYNSVLHVALIPVSAVIHSINVVFSENITSEQGIVQIGFYGIHKHSGDFVLIKKDVVDDVSFSELKKDTYKNIWPRTCLGKTVYEMLCDKNGEGKLKPIETFEQFKDCENVVLTLTLKTKNTTSNPEECTIQVMYTPGAPSTTSLTQLTLDKA